MPAQKITYYDKPAPHIIIDNFLSSKLAKEFIKEAGKLEPKFKDAKTIGENDLFDDCEACQQQKKLLKQTTRHNDVVYLDDTDPNGLMRHIMHDQTLGNPLFLETMRSMPSMFPILNETNYTEQILSRYGTCDFYGWHYDNLGHDAIQRKRIITLIYYFNTEPQKFSGGELILAHPTIKDSKTIKPKHNRLLIFLSHTLHSVASVKFNGTKFEDGRFSINYWLGFE